MDDKRIYAALEKIETPHTAISFLNFNLLHYFTSDMETRIPTFGHEIREWFLSQLDALPLTRIRHTDDRFVFADVGILSGKDESKLEETIKKLAQIASQNPFQKDNFNAAEKFRVKCKDRYKCFGAENLPSLRHELVQFYREADNEKELDGSTKTGPYVRQIFYVGKPLIIPRNIGEAKRMIDEYLAKPSDPINGPNYGIPKGFDVVKELELNKIKL